MDDLLERELQRLAVCVKDAREHALAGEVRRGYSLMLGGFLRAERAAEGQPWVRPLLGRWRAAIEGYCAEFDREADDEERPAPGRPTPKRTGD